MPIFMIEKYVIKSDRLAVFSEYVKKYLNWLQQRRPTLYQEVKSHRMLSQMFGRPLLPTNGKSGNTKTSPTSKRRGSASWKTKNSTHKFSPNLQLLWFPAATKSKSGTKSHHKRQSTVFQHTNDQIFNQ